MNVKYIWRSESRTQQLAIRKLEVDTAIKLLKISNAMGLDEVEADKPYT